MGIVKFGQRSIDDRLARAASGLKHIKPPTGVGFVIEVNFDAKVEKAAAKDPLLIKDFEAAAEDTVSRFVEFVGLKMKATDELVQKLIDANKPRHTLDLVDFLGCPCRFLLYQAPRQFALQGN